MQAIKVFVIRKKKLYLKRTRDIKVQNAMIQLDIKISHFRSLRCQKPDNIAAKGALSSIEYLIKISFNTLKIIHDHFENKKILVFGSGLKMKELCF